MLMGGGLVVLTFSFPFLRLLPGTPFPRVGKGEDVARGVEATPGGIVLKYRNNKFKLKTTSTICVFLGEKINVSVN